MLTWWQKLFEAYRWRKTLAEIDRDFRRRLELGDDWQSRYEPLPSISQEERERQAHLKRLQEEAYARMGTTLPPPTHAPGCDGNSPTVCAACSAKGNL